MIYYKVKRPVLYLAVIFILLTSCIATFAPSDDEAVKLLRDYFSFYNEQGVEAKIIKRGEFLTDCKCYPIAFQIINSKNKKETLTFYFYKDGSGPVEIKKFKIDSKTTG